MKFAEPRPLANPDVAARKLIEIANASEPYTDGRVPIERINGPFLYELKGTPEVYKAGLDRAIEKGWLVLHESGTFVCFTLRLARTCSRETRIRGRGLKEHLAFSTQVSISAPDLQFRSCRCRL